jgi:hypothetical protein
LPRRGAFALQDVHEAKECGQIRQAEIQWEGEPTAQRFALEPVSYQTQGVKSHLEHENTLKEGSFEQKQVADQQHDEQRRS